LGQLYKALDWERLTPSQRAARCRTLASEAAQCGGSAGDGLKKHYQELAEEWRKLALEIEATVDQDEPAY